MVGRIMVGGKSGVLVGSGVCVMLGVHVGTVLGMVVGVFVFVGKCVALGIMVEVALGVTTVGVRV